VRVFVSRFWEMRSCLNMKVKHLEAQIKSFKTLEAKKTGSNSSASRRLSASLGAPKAEPSNYLGKVHLLLP